MRGAAATITKPAQTGQVCPCKGCEHNMNACDRVDYHDHDTEIGCKAKQRRGHKLLVAVKPIETTKRGCAYRVKAVTRREEVS